MCLRFLSILPLVLPAWVLADTTLTYSNERLPGGQTTIQVKDGDVLMGDKRAKMLFKDKEQELVVIDHESKSYMVMDEETAKKLEQQMGAVQEQMDAMMQQMQQQMQNMSEEQRAQLQQMLGDKMPMGSANPVRTTVQQQGKDTVAGVTCTKMMILVNDKPSGDVCVATAGVLGIDTNDYNSMVKATDAVRSFVERVSGRNDNDAVTMNLRAMKGIPVRMRDLVDGDVSILDSRSSAELDAQIFTIPAGYQQKDMMR